MPRLFAASLSGTSLGRCDPVPATPFLTSSNASATRDLPVAGGAGLPPDPVAVAPPLNPTAITPFDEANAFLYTGANPIQTGVAPGAITAIRAAVLRGRVLARDDTPLPGVTITVKDHPEFGQTVSRADGIFDLAANGGGLLTVNYAKTGYLNAQRQVNPAWQNYPVLEDVVLVSKDAKVTTVDLTAATPMQIAQGSRQTDDSGTRQATVLIPQGTTAQIYRPDGSTQDITSLNLRLTEYTIGGNGEKAMPGPLPATSSYTYAVEIGADEADTSLAGKEVLLSQPVPFYVENFLGFPVGIPVPVGYYDKSKSVWIPAPDGRIVKIIGINGRLADLDTDGDGTADNNPTLGITSEERSQLAALYPVGQTLQRVSVDHFSTYDLNYGTSPAPGSTAPNLAPPKPDDVDDPCEASGSIIECENQTLGERLDITGTPFSLNYRSDRVLGRKANILPIPVSGASVPGTLQRIDLEITVAGRVFSQSFPATPDQGYTFIWGGLDAYGRTLFGMQPAQVRIGYVYPGFYNLPPALAASFGVPGGQRIPGDIPSRQPGILWQQYTTGIGQEDARQSAQAEWEISVHHRYDPVSRILFEGGGGRRSVLGAIVNNAITTVAGNGTRGFSGDDGPATQAKLYYPRDIGVGPDGSLYISDEYNNRIRRISHWLPGFAPNEVFLPSEDGTELYRFDTTGRHLSTLNAFTGATLLGFSYDAGGRLSQITDGDGLTTRIERDAAGNTTAIVAPFGQRTTLALDSNGYLDEITNPAGERHTMAYTGDGLLTAFTDPNGQSSTFTYDTRGRLLTDVNADGGSSSLSRTELADGHQVSLTSALNRVVSHRLRNLSNGDRERQHTQPDGSIRSTLEKTDGTVITTAADGTVTTGLQGPRPALFHAGAAHHQP